MRRCAAKVMATQAKEERKRRSDPDRKMDTRAGEPVVCRQPQKGSVTPSRLDGEEGFADWIDMYNAGGQRAVGDPNGQM